MENLGQEWIDAQPDNEPKEDVTEDAPAWKSTFEDENAMWNGYREKQSEYDSKIGKLTNELNQKNEALEQLNSKFDELQQNVSPFTELIQKIGHSKTSTEAEARRAELAEKILIEPDEGIKDVIREYAPEFVEQYVKPLQDKLTAMETRTQADEMEGFKEYITETYGTEVIASTIEKLRQESEAYGANADSYLAQFDNPVVLETRLRAEASETYSRALEDAYRNNDREKLRTLLSKENEPSLNTAQSYGGSGNSMSLVDQVEAEMDKAFEDGTI